MSLQICRHIAQRLRFALAIAFTLFELYTVGFGLLTPHSQRAVMLLFACVLIVLLRPTAGWLEREPLSNRARVAAAGWDLLVLAAAVGSCLYVIVEERALADRSGIETQLDLVVAAIGPLVVMEMVRRAAGFALFLVVLGVLVYGYVGDVVLIVYATAGLFEVTRRLLGLRAAVALLVLLGFSTLFPGLRAWLDPDSFGFVGERHDRMAAYLWLTTEGTFGSIAGIMTEFIFVFILFAAFLEATGAGTTLINLAFALTGRFRGGPAQAAVVASSLFGTVSGSTMANVVSTGTFTIPLMIRTGFQRAFAGAVESVASCGGQIVPPIMGAGVFIMAEVTGVPYVELMLHALIPALLYYASLSTSIYFEAGRIDVARLSAEEIPDGWLAVRSGGYLLVPVLILLVSIISGETPGLAGFKAVLSLLVMFDLVRSLTWVRARAGVAGLWFSGALIVALLFALFGPFERPPWLEGAITIPLIGTVDGLRVALVSLGLLLSLVPAWRGLPIALPLGLGVARWELPTELAWLLDIPIIGWIAPVAIVALVGYLLLLAVIERARQPVDRDQDVRALGRAVLSGMETGARNSLPLVAALSAIGMVVGLLVLAAIGARLSIFVTEVASSSLFLALVLVMIASLVLGMGLPTVAAYVLLVVVVAPALGELGVPLIAGHMFIFYFGVLSSITPPVALAAFAASGIAGARPLAIAITSCRLAICSFIVPYLFVYHPALLMLDGPSANTGYRLLTCALGIVFLSTASMGYGVRRLSVPEQAFMAVAALLVFVDGPWLNATGALAGIGHLVFQARMRDVGERIS